MSARLSLMFAVQRASPKPQDTPLLSPPLSEDLAQVFWTSHFRSSPVVGLPRIMVQARFSHTFSLSISSSGSSRACAARVPAQARTMVRLRKPHHRAPSALFGYVIRDRPLLAPALGVVG